MHKHGNVPDDLIDQYLREELSENALADFELRMLEDPQLFEAVQQAELMRDAFKSQQIALKQQSNVRYLPFRSWIKQPLSMAASVVMCAGVLLVSNFLIQPGSDSLQSGFAVNSVANIGQTRSSADELVLSRGTHLLQVDVGISLNAGPYVVSLDSMDGAQFHEYNVEPDGNGVVRLLTPESLSGRYTLTVQQMGNEERVMSYRIRFD